MKQDRPAMKTVADSLTRATSSRRKTEGAESGGSATKGQQPSRRASAPAKILPSVSGNVVDDEHLESPLGNTLTPVCEADSSPREKSSRDPQDVCSSGTISTPTNSDKNTQSSETKKVSQDSGAYSKVKSLDKRQNTQERDIAGVDSKRRVMKTVQKIQSTTTTITTITTTTTTTKGTSYTTTTDTSTSTTTTTSSTTTTTTSSGNSSGSSSSSSSGGNSCHSSGGEDSDDWCSCSGAEGDEEDTDPLSVDLLEHYDKEVEQIEEEKRKEKDIMASIISTIMTISSLSEQIREYVLQVFGTQKLTADTSQKFTRGRRKDKRSVEREEENFGPNADFQRRLQAVKAYVDKSESIPGRKTEEEARTAPFPEEGACSSKATESSSSGAKAGCGVEIAPSVASSKDGCIGCMGSVEETIRQLSYADSLRKRVGARMSWDHRLAVTLCDAAEQRIIKGKFTCRMLLSCIRSVVDVVGLAVDAYRAAELALQKAKTCRLAHANDIFQAIMAEAAVTSDWMWKALINAEQAVGIHAEIVEATERSERSLLAAQSASRVDDSVIRAAADVKMLIPRTKVFGSKSLQDGEQAPGSTRDSPQPGTSGAGLRDPPAVEDDAGSQSGPNDVLLHLLSATSCSLEAVGATERALHIFAACDWCTGKKARKRRACAKGTVKDKP